MTTDTHIDADILVVDDEAGIRNGCRRVLEACGARVRVEETGREALEELFRTEYDVVVLDLKMPGVDGMEILRRLTEAGSQVVPVMITAHASIETAVEAVKLGAFDYLPKPFVPLELIVKVDRAVRWRRLRQEMEQQLLELDTDKSRLRTVLNSLADGVIVVNRQEQVVLSNPAAHAVLGLRSSKGEPPPLAEVVQDPDLRGIIASTARDPSPSATALTTELRTGERVYMAQVVPIFGARGESLGAVAVLRDVTELTSLERAKSQFMNMVAHELKAPLAAVQGFLKVILTGPELPPEKLHEIIARCSERVEGMAQLVRDLLELSRADTVPRRRVEALALAEVLAEVCERNAPLAESAGVTVSLDVPPDCPPLYADRDEVARVFTNLISNAIKYNVPGGKVDVQVRVDDGWIRASVKDTGLGLPPEAIPRLGEEFFRVNLPDRRGIVGTGLGLSLVKRAVEAYHGRLEVESALGQGSTFTVCLPLGEPPGREAASEAAG